MTITTTFVTVLRRFKYLAEKVMYSDHYGVLPEDDKKQNKQELETIFKTLQLLHLRVCSKIIRGANIRGFLLLHVKCLCTVAVLKFWAVLSMS
jgi:hypothetical protein